MDEVFDNLGQSFSPLSLLDYTDHSRNRWRKLRAEILVRQVRLAAKHHRTPVR